MRALSLVSSLDPSSITMTCGRKVLMPRTSGPMARASFKHGTMATHSADQFTAVTLCKVNRGENSQIALPRGLWQPFAVPGRTNSIAPSQTRPLNTPVMQETFTVSADVLRLRGEAQAALHERAAAAARAHFSKKVFVRAVVEVSNFCRENCAYCGMRRDNKSLARHRAKADQLAELIINHRPESITDINIQTGEDPVAVREVVLPLI